MLRSSILGSIFVFAFNAQAYEVKSHVQLSMLAFEMLKTCNIATSLRDTNTSAWAGYEDTRPYNGTVVTRLRNWHFYNNEAEQDVEFLGGVARFTFHSRWRQLLRNMNEVLNSSQAQEIQNVELEKIVGSLVHFIQDVTNPAHVVPVYHGPKIPLYKKGIEDAFDKYPIQFESLRHMLAENCLQLEARSGQSLSEILHETAQETLDNIKRPLNYSYQNRSRTTTFGLFYWVPSPDKSDDFFGQYGFAGNEFGQTHIATSGRQPVVVDGVAVAQFALEQQLNAVIGTAAAFKNFNRSEPLISKIR